MERVKQFIGYGAALWVILIVASLILRVYETGDSPLFESLKFTVLGGATILLTAFYLTKVKTASLLQGILLGLSWVIIVIVLDVILYLLGLFNLSLGDYFNDVASSYLVVPFITTITAYYLQAKKTR
jgi:hypothetical protein